MRNASFIYAQPGNEFVIKAGNGDWEFYFSQSKDEVSCYCLRKPMYRYLWDGLVWAFSRFVPSSLLALTASWQRTFYLNRLKPILHVSLDRLYTTAAVYGSRFQRIHSQLSKHLKLVRLKRYKSLFSTENENNVKKLHQGTETKSNQFMIELHQFNLCKIYALPWNFSAVCCYSWPDIFSFGLKVQRTDVNLKKNTVEASSRKRKPWWREKSVRDWSWLVTRMVLPASDHDI